MTEMICEVDRDDNFLGLREREEFYSGNYIHRASQLILLNPENKMLIQRRAPWKKWYPNRYTYSVSGTVGNETYEACMEREMPEEIGILVPFHKLFRIPCLIEKGGAFHTVFLGMCPAETVKLIRPDIEEMISINWIELDELYSAIETAPENFTPSLRAGITKIFEEGYDKHFFE